MRKSKVVIPRALAAQDIDEALTHYLDEGGTALGMRFLDALEAAITYIGQNPGTGSPRYGSELDLPGLRAWPLKRFPYLIFYAERSDHIDVWRVLHAKRDIPTWLTDERDGTM